MRHEAQTAECAAVLLASGHIRTSLNEETPKLNKLNQSSNRIRPIGSVVTRVLLGIVLIAYVNDQGRWTAP